MGLELIEYIREKEGEYLGFLRKLVEMESPTADKGRVDLLVDFVENTLRTEGFSVLRIPQAAYGDFLMAETGNGKERIMLIGHLDTVWPAGTLKDFPFAVENRIAAGPGTYDMKGGVLQFIYALKIMKELGLRSPCRILLFLNTDEEAGSPASGPFIEREALKSRYVFVGEGALSEKGHLKTERSGVGFFELLIRGVSAHAGGDPGKGASAIHEFAKQVGAIEAMAAPSRGTTINIGTVKGGTAPNVVAENLEAKLDLRFRLKEEAERVLPLLKSLRPFDERIKITVKGGINRLPMEKTEANIALYGKVKKIAYGLNIETGEGFTGGISDANITSALGIPTLDGLGAVGGGAHSRREHLYIDRIPERVGLLIKILTCIE